MKPLYVDLIPNVLEKNVHYIAKEYNTSVHLCPCGCGMDVVLRLGNHNDQEKVEWTLIEEGELVTIIPSIEVLGGCRSHYHIIRNTIVW
jgi:predicted DNA-binding protein with PD1-like motif